MQAQMQPLARLEGIKKSYPGVKALSGIDFDLLSGEIHCLVGENGAGKSTLMRVLTGATQPDSGTIYIDEKPTVLDAKTRLDHGIGIVWQELDLIPAMSVAENIYIGHEPMLSLGRIDHQILRQNTQKLLSNFDLDVSPDTRVDRLAPAQQQLVQIAKALSHNNRILILDEPTASLTNNEVANLFDLLRKLRQQGLGIVYISHRLEELTAIGDRLTVLRDGHFILTAQVASLSHNDIIKAMVGRPLAEQFPRGSRKTQAIGLEVKELGRHGEFEEISFSVNQGEVLAIAGIIGAGRSELLETLFGLRKADKGSISINGVAVNIRHPRDAVRLGLGLVPEERRESGLILNRAINDNLIYPIINRLGNILHFSRSQMRAVSDRLIKQLSIKAPSGQALAGSLSGGNQQKIVIGKWLAAGVKVLLLDEPTRGVDVNAKAEIYRLIDELAQTGVTVVVVSSELPEVLGISDRVLVIAQGRQTALLTTANTSQEEIMAFAVASKAMPQQEEA
ncbi:sugar ABC transporter ATP-binding protein [Pantoea rwandensis]|nr:sugar ABC transporter ATP-binding protein [Pantoea rwandensis]